MHEHFLSTFESVRADNWGLLLGHRWDISYPMTFDIISLLHIVTCSCLYNALTSYFIFTRLIRLCTVTIHEEGLPE